MNNKKAMMKNLLLKKVLLIFAAILFVVPWANADEAFYVSPTGTGDGSAVGLAASLATLNTKLGALTTSSNTLTVYFLKGETDYVMPSGGLIIRTTPSATMGQLAVIFKPLSDQVTITGWPTPDGSTGKFVTMNGFSTTNNVTLTIENMRIRNFTSTTATPAANLTGSKSLFTVGTSCRLNLNGVLVENISSHRNPLMSVLANGKFYATDCEFVGITKLNTGTTDYDPLFETAAAGTTAGGRTVLNFDNCLLDRWIQAADNGTGTQAGSTFYIEDTYADLIFKDCKITNCRADYQFARITGAYTAFEMSGCEVTGNTFANIAYGGIAAVYNGTYGTGTIYNNSVYGNTTQSVFYTPGGTSTIYNNTISGNTSSYSIYNATTNSTILNNTIYNSGDLYTSAITNTVIKNNLVVGTSKINPSLATAGGTAASVSVANNISNGRFYSGAIPAGGTTGGTQIVNLASYYNTSRTEFVRPVVRKAKMYVHELTQLNDVAHPILRHGDVTGYETLLATDQRGETRPLNCKISIGAWDSQSVSASAAKASFAYDPEEGLVAGSETLDIDLSGKIRLPDGITLDDPTVTVTLNAQLGNGTLTQDPLNKTKFTFTPTPGGTAGTIDDDAVGQKSTTTYTVSYYDAAIDMTYSATAEIEVTIVNVRSPMGLIDESYYSCFGMMDENITFEANIKYKTSDEQSGAGNYFYGFSIPLIGDLDGDGYAEVVSMIYGTGTGSNFTHMAILNGQSGEIIVKVPFDATGLNIGEFMSLPGGGYHGPPSHIALVDADRNGYPEIIVAVTNSSNTTYTKRLVSLEVNDNTFLPTSDLAIGSPSRFTIKWVSNMDYTQRSETNTSVWAATSAFVRPLPQIVDIDGDGEAEVIVYNKVYNAVDGTIRIVFDDLGPDATYDNATAADRVNPERPVANPYKNFAYTGRNRNAQHVTDRFLTQISVYDLDMDGKYEIIAGGKVYYDLDPQGTPGSGNWKVKSADLGLDGLGVLTIGDGYTAVADVNGDGKAEIIVYKTMTAGNPDIFKMQVWNPGFLVRSGNSWVKPANQATSPIELLAEITIPATTDGRTGSNSFLFVGDIDGKINTNAYGEKVKLPEISIIAGEMYSSAVAAANRKAVPIHPNANASQFSLSSVAASLGCINYQTSGGGYTVYGALMSWTWDETDATVEGRLKVSFGMEHSDSSLATGFTFFDFDNDGAQDIVYRDERTLRIISPGRSWVPYGTYDSDKSIVKFSTPVVSWTAYEMPVVADVDNDGSADMLVMGYTSQVYYGYIYTAQEDPNVGKFAPAPNVWNQFHYSPLKINKDLTTPLKNRHPLDPDLGYIKNTEDNTKDDYMVKDYIYNNPITQVVEFGLFDSTDPLVTEKQWAPIVPWPEANIPSGYMDVENSQAAFWVKNSGDAALNQAQRIAVYRARYGAPATGSSGRTEGYITSIPISTTEDVRPGDSVLVTYPLTAAELYDVYYFRVLDGSASSGGTFYAGFYNEPYFPAAYKDCNWLNNSIKLSAFTANDDVYNVAQYTKTELRILDNDQFPSACSQNLLPNDFVTPGGRGVMKGDWGEISVTPDGQGIYYVAPRTYSNVVEITYDVHCDGNTETGIIYIFVTESCTNTFAVCYGSDVDVCVKGGPAGTTFNWYSDATGGTQITAPGTQSNVTSTLTFYSKPVVLAPFDMIDFPVLPITITPISDGLTMAEMKWTGAYSLDWNDPKNWQIKNSSNVFEDATFAPSTCVDATLPKGVDQYPVLTDDSYVNNVIMEDRAMLSRTHKLTYNEAKVSVNFTASERDRWVMYSAPLRKTYSGDYMLVDYSGQTPTPIRRAVYMNFFQSAHPDKVGGLEGQGGHAGAQANTFTKPFGSVAAALPLGKPFNIWIDTDIDTTTPFVLPSPFQQYQYNVHGLWQDPETGQLEDAPVLDRTDGSDIVSGRFIVEDKPAAEVATDGSFSLAAADDDLAYEIIMIPNPFMAYLDMTKFLTENVAALQSGYKVWDGTSDFVTYHLQEFSWYDRLWIVDNPDAIVNNPDAPQYVAPLQSFMVAKQSAGILPALKFNPTTMTITTRPSGISGDYQLRSATGGSSDPAGLLRIKVSNGSRNNSTVVFNLPGASNSYGSEDSRKAFYNYKLSGYSASEMDRTLSVYTLTPNDEEALAINTMGDFSQDVPVGVKLNFEGQLTFDFTGIENFGHPLYFKDGNNVIDLSTTPTYTAEVSGNGGNLETFYEVNTRFYLSTNNQVGIEDGGNIGNNIYITSTNGSMTITSDNMLQSVELYSTLGNIAYKNAKPATSYQIDRLISGQVYIVKITTEFNTEIRKVIVK